MFGKSNYILDGLKENDGDVLTFKEDEEYELPDTHEWIEITTHEDAANGLVVS